jgi:hypothetical protein
VNVEHLDLDLIAKAGQSHLTLPWPSGSGMFTTFDDLAAWKRYIEAADLDARTPLIVAESFHRAQKLYLLGWIDLDAVGAGELAALISLEMALRDRYGKKDFSNLLRHMVERDGLSDEDFARRTGVKRPVVAIVRGEIKPTLSQRRNGMAHGSAFRSLPLAGLLELVRDLIEYAYRGYYLEAPEPASLRTANL